MVNPGPDLLSNQLDLTSFSLAELRSLHQRELDAAICRTIDARRTSSATSYDSR